MSSLWGAVVCATALWAIVIATAYFEPVKRPAGEAWVVTASEKMPSRPALVRAHVPFKTAAVPGTAAEGYVTHDRRWICETCYEDFKLMFEWVLET